MPGITLGVSDRRKNGRDEVQVPVLSGVSCEGAGHGNLEDGSEELED